MKKKQKHHISHFAWIGMIAYLAISILLVQMNATFFQASIIPMQQAPAFDGLTSPVKQSPDWVGLSTAEWDMSYNQLNQRGKLVSFPTYNPSNLKISTDSLKWGNPTHDAIRNEKITFSVPYMGNYRLDGHEYAGSHLAVDIKVPSGTPVYAIGNGIVYKTSEQLYGFGKHIVIKHKNFPSFDNPSRREDYYSSYSHLSTLAVNEGAVVRKGDLIGYSGSTGTSTTPHVHFQIDNDNAPWHPFWPFTSTEAANAGMNFTQAVNAGLNQSIAIRNTINPFLYIQKHNTGTTPSPVVTEPIPEPETEPVEPETIIEPSPVSENLIAEETDTNLGETTEEVSTEDPTKGYVTFDIQSQTTFEEDKPFTVTITATTRTGEIIRNYVPESPVKIAVNRGKAEIEPRRLSAQDFNNGVAKLTVTPKNASPFQFQVKTETLIKESPVIAEGLFVDVNVVHPHFEAISFLKNEGVIQGYPDGSFKPENTVSRVEVLKFILEGIDAQIANAKTLPFSDTENGTWYANYLQTALYLNIIDGYPDGSFKPSNTVNKAEFMKMLIEAMNIDIDPEVRSMPLVDVDTDAWYAPYAQFTYQKNIMDFEDRKFNANEYMTRENVAEAMYRVQVLSQTGATRFDSDIADEFARAA